MAAGRDADGAPLVSLVATVADYPDEIAGSLTKPSHGVGCFAVLDIRRPGLRRRLTLALIRLHAVAYRTSGGRLGSRIAGMPVLLLTTAGRRSGRRRTTPLTYLTTTQGLVLIASAGGSDRSPAWALNLMAQPVAEIRLGRRVVPVRARPTTGEERHGLWRLVVSTWPGYARYQARTTREIPVFLLEELDAQSSSSSWPPAQAAQRTTSVS
jgi:deazaflavin-dependent oxidoreductase (nitroreductase family)